jgi:hypothetical protein
MNKLAFFAKNELMRYADETGYRLRDTSDLSRLEEWLLVQLYSSRKDSLEITLEDYDHRCSDGCCYDYGTVTTVNGCELEAKNSDVAGILTAVLEHLGYKVTVGHI